MANDIQVSISGVIKNGTLVASCLKTGKYSKLDTYAQNNPTMNEIQNKYDNRFDDITYYTIGGSGVIVGG